MLSDNETSSKITRLIFAYVSIKYAEKTQIFIEFRDFPSMR